MFIPVEIIENEKSWMERRCDSSLWNPVVETILDGHKDLLGLSVTYYKTGSAVVSAIGQKAVVKILPPEDIDCFNKELCALTICNKGLDIPTPVVIGSGRFEGCPYLVMEQLEGQQLSEVWDSMSLDKQTHIIDSIGKLSKSLHRLSTDDDSSLNFLGIDGPNFIKKQIETATKRQHSRKLPDKWCSQIDSFLAKHSESLLAGCSKALLHTEIMTDHFLIEQKAGQWKISGLFDFADSMLGNPYYELSAVGLFISAGNRKLLQTFLLSYRFSEDELNEEFSQRMMAWTLCHKYCHIPWYLEMNSPSRDETTLEHLALKWFAL